MVQIRHCQRKPPSSRRTLPFWSRVRLGFRKRRQRLKESVDESGTGFRDGETDSDEDGPGKLCDLQRLGRKTKKRFFGFARNWKHFGTRRWLCLAARNRIRIKGDARVGWAFNGRKRGKGKRQERKMTGLDRAQSHKRSESWAAPNLGGNVKSMSWVNGKGSKSIHAPLIERDWENESCKFKEEGGVKEGYCKKRGDGTRVIWRSKEKCAKDIPETGELEGQQGGNESSVQVVHCGCSSGRFWRSRERYRKSLLETDCSGGQQQSGEITVGVNQPTLPDDVLEMCLARIPFAALLRARAVCKKWQALTMSPHFLQFRASVRPRDPWLFLFGLSRDGVCLGQIQALDPASSRWHTIKADILTGRLSYSVTAINSVIYVVGGCSSNLRTSSGRTDKDSMKTIKTVLMYTPLTSSWRKVCPLTTERASPVVGAFKLRRRRTPGSGSNHLGSVDFNGRVPLSWATDLYSVTSSPAWSRGCERGSRRGGELAVYGGSEIKRGEVDVLTRAGSFASRKSFADLDRNGMQESCVRFLEADFNKLHALRNTRTGRSRRRVGLIVVGGQGAWNEQLHSAEIYDPVTDNWREVASMPAEHGAACAGVVCKNFFYVYSDINKLVAYDLEHDVWHSVRVSQAPARLPNYTPKLVSCQGRIFLLGVDWGITTDGGSEMALRKIWELHQESNFTGWVKVSQHPDAPLDWNAVFVADEDIIYGVEMFKIFGQMLDFVTICKISGSEAMSWQRVSKMEMATHAMDPSSCFTKTAVVAQL